MRTKLSPTSLIVTVLAGVGVLFAATPSFAVTIPAFPSGQGAPTCLSETNGGVANKCGTATQFWVTLAVNAGSHQVNISATSPNGDPQLWCSAYGSTQGGDIITGNSSTALRNDSVMVVSVTIPSSGTIFVKCNMPNDNSVIHNISYSEL